MCRYISGERIPNAKSLSKIAEAFNVTVDYILHGKSIKLESEFNVNDRIDMVEARKLIEIVTMLATKCAFTHLESMKIAKVCAECCERLEIESDE